MSKKIVLDVQNLHHGYGKGRTRVDVLKGASLSVQSGEMVALLGESGSGKSTFLQIAGLLEKPEKGKIVIAGEEVKLKSDKQRTMMRRHQIGFVYQFHHLLPEFTALENVTLPQYLAGVSEKEATEKAMHLLTRVGLSKRATHRPSELSGGEQQRVAIVRALANDPVILIADEPTGNLDPVTGESIFEMLKDLLQKSDHPFGMLMATHNHDFAKKMNRIHRVENGVVKKV